MKLLVCGGRDYHDYERAKDSIAELNPSVIISGMAKGADNLAVRYAEEFGIPLEKYPAQWHQYGNRAGPIRNQQMLDEGRPDVVLAFPGGKGTAHMKRIAEKAGVHVIEDCG